MSDWRQMAQGETMSTNELFSWLTELRNNARTLTGGDGEPLALNCEAAIRCVAELEAARAGILAPSRDRWWSQLHHLWTKAVGTPDYDKDEWIALEALLLGGAAPLAPRPEKDQP